MRPLLKLIQLSDPHLRAGAELVHGFDPAGRLRQCLVHIAAHHRDADLVVISGDLADDGSSAAYQFLRQAIGAFPIRVELALGNHDRRANFAAVFGHQGEFAQSIIAINGFRIVITDTLDEGRDTGMLCDKRLAWLDAALAQSCEHGAVVISHHPPFQIGVAELDVLGIANAEEARRALLKYGNVRHVCSGHVHAANFGRWRDLSFNTAGSSSHGLAVIDGILQSVPCPAGYAVLEFYASSHIARTQIVTVDL